MVKKSDIIESVAKRAELKSDVAAAAVNAMIAELEAALVAGEKVQFLGFGTFEVKERAERMARNPRTGEAITAPASKYVTFSSGKNLKEAVNK